MELKNPSIKDLERIFASIALPVTIQLGPGGRIIDVKKFVEIYVARYKGFRDRPVYQVYYEKLLKLYTLLSNDERDQTIQSTVSQ